MAFTVHKDVEVSLKSETPKAVIEGKTAIPFQTFVTLVLQRKVFSLFKMWGKEPVILSSDLLTQMASAPQDTQESRTHLVVVSLGVGVLVGVFVLAVGQVILRGMGLTLATRELLLIAAGIIALGILTAVLARAQRGRKSEKVTESIEKLAEMLSRS